MYSSKRPGCKRKDVRFVRCQGVPIDMHITTYPVVKPVFSTPDWPKLLHPKALALTLNSIYQTLLEA